MGTWVIGSRTEAEGARDSRRDMHSSFHNVISHECSWSADRGKNLDIIDRFLLRPPFRTFTACPGPSRSSAPRSSGRRGKQGRRMRGGEQQRWRRSGCLPLRFCWQPLVPQRVVPVEMRFVLCYGQRSWLAWHTLLKQVGHGCRHTLA
jgi:hypothetical protein